MGRAGWLALNAVLLVGAWAATAWVAGFHPSAEVVAPARGSRGDLRETPSAPSAAVKLPAPDLTVLWERTLFRPERTEAIATSSEAPEAAPPEPVPQFELVAVTRIGGEPVAWIAIGRPKRAPTGTRRNQPKRLPHGQATRPQVPGAAASAGDQTAEKNLYCTGDEVADTGYVVREVELTCVILQKNNDEPITVGLDWANDAGMVRAQAAVAAAEKDRRARAADVAAQRLPTPVAPARGADATPEPTAAGRAAPPAPPPPPGGAGVPPVGTPPAADNKGASEPAPAPTSPAARARAIREQLLLRRRAAGDSQP